MTQMPASAGYEDKALHLDCSQASFLLQPQGSPPVIERALAYSVDDSSPIETHRSARLMLVEANSILVVHKRESKTSHAGMLVLTCTVESSFRLHLSCKGLFFW